VSAFAGGPRRGLHGRTAAVSSSSNTQCTRFPCYRVPREHCLPADVLDYTSEQCVWCGTAAGTCTGPCILACVTSLIVFSTRHACVQLLHTWIHSSCARGSLGAVCSMMMCSVVSYLNGQPGTAVATTRVLVAVAMCFCMVLVRPGIPLDTACNERACKQGQRVALDRQMQLKQRCLALKNTS
jgi:hypothetical protein